MLAMGLLHRSNTAVDMVRPRRVTNNPAMARRDSRTILRSKDTNLRLVSIPSKASINNSDLHSQDSTLVSPNMAPRHLAAIRWLQNGLRGAREHGCFLVLTV